MKTLGKQVRGSAAAGRSAAAALRTGYMSAGKGAACTPYSFAGSAETAQRAQKIVGCSLLRRLVRGAPCFGPVSAVTAHTTCSSHQFVITPLIMRCCSDLSPQQRLLEFW